MTNFSVKPLLCAMLIAGSITGCVSNAVMQMSDQVAAQPAIAVKTDGKFGGFGTEGTFTIAQQYTGRFSRDSSQSSWFNTFGSKDAGLIAEITNETSQTTWQIQCHGEQHSLSLGGLTSAKDAPFSCNITTKGENVGHFTLQKTRSLMGAGEESGSIQLDDTTLQIKAVTKAKGSSFSTGGALGYSFTLNEQEIAATQTNGGITMQTLPTLTAAQKDAVAVGSIASALSWRPADDSE